LATKLLDYEPRAGKQVPLLLDMKQDEVALVKAIESGDTDLSIFKDDYTNPSVLVVMQHLRKKLPLAQFFKVINDKPIAYNLFEGWAKQFDRELLKDFYYQDDRKAASAGILINQSLEQIVCGILD
jgi:vacuolar protein sorting-associated protein 16